MTKSEIDTKDEELREYELAVLLKGENALESLILILRKHGIVPDSQSPFERIRLAYPIKKENEAEFGFLCFKSLPDKIQLIDKELRLVSYALRFLLIAREKVVSHNISKHEEVSSAPTSPQITPESQAAPAKNMLSNEELKARLEEILK
ncbi:MAG: hypothetical protein A3A04_01660 [Candidatus Harrisonbacteria bacterium RIFCSPLOWO2_01_FULL_40_28]|uniref:Small ribosomal subunit protein bS6 n=2 Tax=Candidatus Harrisoniibacteriota TaxID=1817905 RepID=A0A1G1ZW25_9BACT|nr:MAG: hypothetical protein A3A04_01660 [Candidatus Harrisonbacteria bacterium RIFCSPLOWO2_01_FULL_40_28]OGY68675.1 MAG: hypothetical protein A2586_00605 [Candidatus Harrisonbacteria bacterium RIFOXYD1_FULL_40_9]